MKPPIWLIPLVTIGLIFGAWALGKAIGEWEISGRQQTTVIGSLTPDDVRGWLTMQDAADGLGIPVEEVIALIEAPAGVEITPQTAFKELEELIPGFELTGFREVLRAHLAGTSAPASTSPSAPPATSATAPSTTPVQPSPTPTGTPRGGGGTPTGTGQPGGQSTQEITGQQTLQQVADAHGLDVAALIAESGLPADTDPRTQLKTLRDTVPGFEIQQVRDAVARMLG